MTSQASTIYRGYDIGREPLLGKFVVRWGGPNTQALFTADTEEEAMNWIDAKRKAAKAQA